MVPYDSRMFIAVGLAVGLACAATVAAGEARKQMPEPLKPTVEIEEDVYHFEPANNGSDPMWCWGSTCLTRAGGELFASGLETLKEYRPLNNVRWLLFRRGAEGWERVAADEKGRTREPCPIVGFSDGQLFLSANPTLLTDPKAEGGGPARPEILRFDAKNLKAGYETLLPEWDGKPPFTEHTYRTFAADGPGRELILFNNIGYDYAEWCFRDRDGRWAARGRLAWPPKEEPVEVAPYHEKSDRITYPNVVLKDRAVHLCGAAAYNTWSRVTTPDKMGRNWGNRWRRLYYTWTPDILSRQWKEWVLVANTQENGGWLFPGDLWVGPDGTVHLLWYEGPIGKALRDQFFPDIKRTWAWRYARIRNGKVVYRRTLLEGGEGINTDTAGETGGARFQVTPDNRLFVIYFLVTTDESGKRVPSNRVMEILPDGSPGESVVLPLQHPLRGFFTATHRGGSPPSTTVDLLGYRYGTQNQISYARVRLW
ncbi:MAG TPA: hypothetical protein PLU39_09405 [Armatimonadota bacterium]|nr:hypothetical protein [Armatimonadota bacterium]HOJ22517.1 hypothetical protein [Armatimonadota bacterium]HOM82471.1 hypothetical protein [Armatimonadota bacterium]HPO72522.1 hypothetical protein [Armatimonadota bacterium]HPT98072.1 hypothetical protein [Armatimonadota bacterium]